MEAKDLMIGDWLQYYDCNLNKQCYAQVTSIQADGPDPFVQTSDSDVYYLVEMYKPITLTPEILEKNGFVKRSDRNDKLGKMEYYQFEDYGFVYHYSDGEWGFNLGNNNPKLRDFSGYLNYVHEMQHVLNILNIEKEIKL